MVLGEVSSSVFLFKIWHLISLLDIKFIWSALFGQKECKLLFLIFSSPLSIFIVSRELLQYFIRLWVKRNSFGYFLYSTCDLIYLCIVILGLEFGVVMNWILFILGVNWWIFNWIRENGTQNWYYVYKPKEIWESPKTLFKGDNYIS